MGNEARGPDGRARTVTTMDLQRPGGPCFWGLQWWWITHGGQCLHRVFSDRMVFGGFPPILGDGAHPPVVSPIV